jgi:hypothetical protein
LPVIRWTPSGDTNELQTNNSDYYSSYNGALTTYRRTQCDAYNDSLCSAYSLTQCDAYNGALTTYRRTQCDAYNDSLCSAYSLTQCDAYNDSLCSAYSLTQCDAYNYVRIVCREHHHLM